jgi:CheY-like chemotaxis protein
MTSNGAVKIMLVSDQAEDLDANTARLRLYGYEVIPTRQSQEALDKAFAQNPDLILWPEVLNVGDL